MANTIQFPSVPNKASTPAPSANTIAAYQALVTAINAYNTSLTNDAAAYAATQTPSS